MDKNNTIVTEVANNSTANSTSEIFAYDFQVKLENGDDLEFKVPSNVIMMDSPLRGYRNASGARPMLGSTNRLVYTPLDKSILPRILFLCGASLLVGLMIGAGVMYAVGQSTNIFDPNPIVTSSEQTEQVTTPPQQGAEPKQADTKDVKPETKPTEVKTDTAKAPAKAEVKQAEQPVAAPVDASVIAAVKYLEETPVWNRTAMEEHAPLKGLWDALNTRSFKKVALKKYDCLNSSKKFVQLRTIVKELENRSWETKYTSIGDEDITIDTYMSRHKALISTAN